MDVFANGITSADAEMVLEAQVRFGQQTPARRPRPTQWLAKPSQRANPHARAWTGNQPMPHRGAAAAYCRLLHCHSQRFGFRTMEVREGGGCRQRPARDSQGVDRHSFWPHSGVVSE
jgi:hypothetical protein